MKKENTIQFKNILSFKEALAYLDISDSFLYKMTHKNLIRFFKPSGKLIYFKRSDLDHWMLQNEFKSVDGLEREINNRLKMKNHGRK